MWGQLWLTGWQHPARSCCLRKDNTFLRSPFFFIYLNIWKWPLIKCLLLNWVVAGKGDETSPAYAERVKDLGPSIEPGCGLHQLVHLWQKDRGKMILASSIFVISNYLCWQSETYVRCEEKLDSTQGPFESQSSDQEDSQHDVWKNCCNIHSLRKYKYWLT